MPSGIEFPPDTRAKFLQALEQTGKVSGPQGAAELVGVAVPTLYAWRTDDPEFAKAWDHAIAVQTTVLAERGLTVIEEILADETHKDRFAAAKFAAERGEHRATADREGADAGIAEAIDRFTSLVAHAISVRELRDPPSLRAAITSGAPLRERES